MLPRGSTFIFDIMPMASSDGIAYWTGYMRGRARIRGAPDSVPMTVRVTEVLRREDGAWKMVRRRADPLGESKTG